MRASLCLELCATQLHHSPPRDVFVCLCELQVVGEVAIYKLAITFEFKVHRWQANTCSDQLNDSFIHCTDDLLIHFISFNQSLTDISVCRYNRTIVACHRYRHQHICCPMCVDILKNDLNNFLFTYVTHQNAFSETLKYVYITYLSNRR